MKMPDGIRDNRLETLIIQEEARIGDVWVVLSWWVRRQILPVGSRTGAIVKVLAPARSGSFLED